MSAEDILRDEINKCRNCEACKSLLDLSCVVFPEMFRLADEERETGKKISTHELRYLANLCNFCAMCPCPDIRAAIMNAKTEYVEKHGLSFRIRAIENVERIGKLGSAIPQLTNFLLQTHVTGDLTKKTLGLHRNRKVPIFPKENLSAWLKSRHNKRIRHRAKDKKKVAYFAGCTARYFFPEIPKAVIDILERNGIEVVFLEQQCCGMPSLLEGDRKLTLEFARFNVARLAKAVEDGYQIVCSCPTCGFMLKNVLKVGAHRFSKYRGSADAHDGFVKIPVGGGVLYSVYGPFIEVPEVLLETMLRDDGYFSSISQRLRIMVSENTFDLGEFLRTLHMQGEFDTSLGPVSVRVAYYPPCHLREQRMGRPYEYLLNLIPKLSVKTITGDYCCGNAGIMGFKQEFHHLSIKIASRLIAKIKTLKPEVIATDCLSCRMQFNQLINYKVLHPVQMIKESYNQYRGHIETSKRSRA